MTAHHSIDYVEFPARDLSEAKRFYADAFGWEFNDYGDAYTGIRGAEPGAEMGGFSRTDDAGAPLVILYSDDLDATLAAVRDAGGRVVAEPYDFPGGRRFEFEDPDGHHLAVWTHAE